MCDNHWNTTFYRPNCPDNSIKALNGILNTLKCKYCYLKTSTEIAVDTVTDLDRQMITQWKYLCLH